MANEKLIVELSAQIQGLKAGLDNASEQISKFNDKVNNGKNNTGKDFDAIGAAAKKLGGIVAGAFALDSIISFGKGVIDVTSQFQKFEAVLSNTLGSSSAAQLALSQIQEFAATTPFQIDELTGAFVKLANQGFKPNMQQMRLLGDLASSTGKSFDQLAEAILDAQTGEFERLKEFGVKASVAGEKVTFTFKGIKTQVDNTSDSIKNYVLSLGSVEGVSGSMEKISGTLGGRISNVSDSFSQLQVTIGKLNSGALFTFVSLLQKGLSTLNEYVNIGINRKKFSMSALIDGDEAGRIVDDYNKQISKIGATTDISKLQEHLKFIQTNMTFYEQAMKKETNAHNRDIMFSYFNAYKDIRKVANAQMDGLQKELEIKNKKIAEQQKAAAAAAKPHTDLVNRIEFKPGSMDAQAAVEYDVSSLFPVEAINSYTSDMNLLTAAEDKRFQITDEHFGKIQSVYIPTQDQLNVSLEQQNQILTAQTMLMGTLTGAFDQMFTTILDGGQNAFQGILNSLKSLMIKIAAAIAAAAVLFVLTGGLSAGGSKLGSIGNIAKTMGGLGFNPFTLFSGGSSMVAMPTASTGQGSYQVDIMGDKMRMLLDNQAIKNSRVI
jgi:hypothetical protein